MSEFRMQDIMCPLVFIVAVICFTYLVAKDKIDFR